MKKLVKFSFIVTVILTITIPYCRNNSDIKLNKQLISIRSDLCIGAENIRDDNYIFGDIGDIEVDSLGNIYVLDRKLKTIKKMNEMGKFVGNIGGKGQGPGEFLSPKRISVDINNNLYILDTRKVLIFDQDGEFSNSFNIDFRGVDIKVNSKMEIIILGLKYDKIFHIYNRKGEYLYSFGEVFKVPSDYSEFRDDPYLKIPINVFLDKKDQVYVFNPFKYEIWIYGNNKLINIIKRRTNPIFYRPPIVSKFPYGFVFGYIGCPTLIEIGDKLLIFLYGVKKGEESYKIDIFKNYKYKGSILPIEICSLPFAVDNKSRIYCVKHNDFPAIIRYKLRINI